MSEHEYDRLKAQKNDILARGNGLHWAEGHGCPTICGLGPQSVHVSIGHHPWDVHCEGCHRALEAIRMRAWVAGRTLNDEVASGRAILRQTPHRRRGGREREGGGARK